VYKRWCEGEESQSRIAALAPGADASRSDLGDATCQPGNTEFILYDASGAELQTFMVPVVGVLRIDNLPETGNGGSYRIFDTRSSESATFQIASALTTKVISLQWMEVRTVPDQPLIPTIVVDDNSPPPPGGECFDDGCDYEFGGPVAEPGSGDPFTVADDLEAESRVGEIDSFEDMPGVGIGPGRSERNDYVPWLAALAMICGAIVTMRVHASRR
jgi:hypothetical protein